MFCTWATSKRLAAYPMLPARPKTSGGSERMAKKAASAASPVTRDRKQELTVDGMRRHNVSRIAVSRDAGVAALSIDDAAIALRERNVGHNEPPSHEPGAAPA